MSQADSTDETGPSPEPAKKPRVRKKNPGGSTSSVRTGLLEALGVLKIVNGNQMWRLLRPGAHENKFARAGLNDLEKKGLVLSEGNTKESLKTWGLTRAGKEAAQQVLPAGREVGSIARGAGVHGAAHAMAVNDAIIAFIRGGTDGGGSLGSLFSWHTEYPIEPRPGLKVQPDAVLRAPEHGLPALLVEVDRHSEHRPVLAGKFPNYAAVFAHQSKVADPTLSRPTATKQVPYWHQHFPEPVRDGYPPVAVVFTNERSDVSIRNRMRDLCDATRTHWEGTFRHGYTDYSRAIPILVTTLDLLQEHGPLAPIWWRFGHTGRETLEDALANPDDERSYWQARRARERAEQAALEEEERLALEQEMRDATRCPDCGRAADEYPDPREASDGDTPCCPCARDREQRDLAAATTKLHKAIRHHTRRLAAATVITPAWNVLAHEALTNGREAYAAWQARRAENTARPPLRAPRAAAAAPEPQRQTAPERTPRAGGRRTPAARTALQQILSELEAQRTGPAAPSTEPPHPQQPGHADQARRAVVTARYAGISEPLRSRLVDMVLQHQDEQDQRST